MRNPPISSDADKTPRQSGSVESWPLYKRLAEQVGTAAARAFFVCAERGTGLTPEANARLEAIATEARKLASDFAMWERGDPGDDRRRLAMNRLLDMRQEAKDLGADL